MTVHELYVRRLPPQEGGDNMELFSAVVVLLNALAVDNQFVADFAVAWIVYIIMHR